MKPDVETPQEMLDRLSLIVLGERDCDLSDHDCEALEFMLTTRAVMYDALKYIVAHEKDEILERTARAAILKALGEA